MSNEKQREGKCIIFSAPSGAGKTTIVNALLDRFDRLAFSISACSRPARTTEKDGKDYYFLAIEDFKNKIKENAFIEWEEVYTNHFYGTLKAEVERLWAEGKVVIFDVDVYGGVNLKKYFGEAALSFFVMPPSINVLEKRLRKRQTESEEKIRIRINKASEELSMSKSFDKVILNEDLDNAIEEAATITKEFIEA